MAGTAECTSLAEIQSEAPATPQVQKVFQELERSKKVWEGIYGIYDSVTGVMGLWANQKQTGGRKLETNRPLDEKAARAELEGARRDPEIGPRIEQLRKEVPDEDTRLVLEAANT